MMFEEYSMDYLDEHKIKDTRFLDHTSLLDHKLYQKIHQGLKEDGGSWIIIQHSLSSQFFIFQFLCV